MTTEAEALLDGKITEEALAYLRSKIGQFHTVRPWNSVATADAIWHFALGIGDDNPIYWDSEYAKSTPQGAMTAPPTFLYSFSSGPRRKGDPSTGSTDEFLPGVLGLWAWDRWHWNRPVREGERISAKRGIDRVEEKASRFSGRGVNQVEKTLYYDQQGAEVAVYERNIMRIERAQARSRGRYADLPRATYTPEEIRAINAQYAKEPEQRRGAKPRLWDEVVPGEALTKLVKGPLTITSLVGWCMGWGSNMCPTNRMAYQFMRDFPATRLIDPRTNIEDTQEGPHWDDFLAQQSGLARGYDFGGLRVSWFAHLMTDWLGDAGTLTDLFTRILEPNFLGDTVWLTGRLRDKRLTADGAVVDCELEATNQRGAVVAVAQASAILPRSSGSRAG
jgi:acyl dehydratase